jgi:tetratricopeptide (TPR) repeat protein
MDKVAGAARHQPWLVVASRRDVPVGWLPAEDLRRVDLRVLPLTAEDSLRLAAAAADGHALPRPALAALARRADGNPLFLESLVGQAGPAGTLDGLPDSVEEVLAAQIDRLPPARRDVLRRAAVLGNQFSQAQLLALLPDPSSSVDDQLSDGLGEFLVPVDSGRELRFRHALVRDVAYQGLAFRARRRMHDQVGLALEGGQGPARPEVLSFHFLHAGRYLKAWSYARTAGEDAKRKYANTEATELLGRAVEAARHLPRDTVPARELGLVLESLGDCWFTIGLSDAALASYREAHRKVRGDIFDSARIVAKQAAVDGRLRRFPQAMGRISRQLRAFDGLDGVDVHRARSTLLRRYAISRACQGRLDDARRWGADAVTEAKRSKDPEVLAPAYGTLHGVYLAAGLEDHHALGTLALRSYVEIDDLSGQAQCTNNLAVAALEDHRWPEAATMFGRAADLYRRRGDIDNEGVALCNHAEVLVNQGRCDVAAPLLDEALAIARSVADDELRALVLRQQGRARARTGEPAEGLALLQEARVLFATIGADDEAARTDLSIAEATLLSGDLTGALHRTEALLAGTELDDQRAEAHALRGFALLRLDRRDEAVREFRHGAPGHGRVRGYGEALSCLGLAEAGVERASAWTERGWRALRSLDVVAPPAPAERGPVESALVASE